VSRPPDLAFEALVRVTHANEHMERGRLNAALKGIRACWQDEGGLPEDLPQEIERRADAYQAKWPTLTLTPMALATHWVRVVAQRPGVTKSPAQEALDRLKGEQ
jgi:hypothetical protein